MAGFDDSKDIKINVTLDTAAAVKAAQDLKTAIESSLKSTETQFQKIETAITGLSSKIVKEAKGAGQAQVAVLDKTVAATSSAADKIAKITADAAAKKVREEQKAQALILDAQKVAARQAEIAGRQLAEKEKTRRTQLLKDIAELNLKRTEVMKAPRAKAPPGLGDIGGSGKVLEALGGVAVSLGNRFGFLTVNATQAFKVLSALGTPGLFASGLIGLKLAADKASEAIDKLALEANKLEGLKTGFETLQRSIGQSPTAAIEALRKATQGLISDTDLYVRSNQAVLLGVPTDIFNEAAAAAVKLGRAMGIDAAFGLESLSLGLGRQSRLYLDNLGIVVSAEEAYRKFGLTVRKSAADLDDSEKKAAFFAEALFKIKQRANELPDPLDTVGTAQTKLNVAQENANRLFLEAFNNSSSLTNQYKNQAAIVEINGRNAQIYGAALAELGTVAKFTKNAFDLLGAGIKSATAEVIDFVFRVSDAKKFEDLTAKIESNIEVLKFYKKSLDDNTKNSGQFSAATRQSQEYVDRLTASLKQDIQASDKLKTSLGLLGNQNIKINIDVSGIEKAQENIKNLFADIKTKASEDAGVIPGFSTAEAAAILDKYRKAKEEFDNSLNKTEALDKFKSKIDELEATVAGAPIKAAVEKLGTGIGDLAKAANAGDFSKAVQTFGALGGSIKEAAGAARAGQVGLKAFSVSIEKVDVAVAESAKVRKQNTKDTLAGIKKEEKAFDNFVKSLRRTLKTAIPKSFQKELIDTFNNGGLSVEQFEKAIKDLAKRAKDAGVDIDAFKKEIADLQALADKGVELKVNADTSQVNADIQDSLKNVQSGMPNIRELIFGKDPSGKASGGGFFGFDLGGEISSQIESGLATSTSVEALAGAQASIASAVANAFSLAVDLAFTEGITSDDAGELGAQIGGALFGQLGATFGRVIGEVIKRNFGDSKATTAVKEIDKYFATLFDGERLTIVAEGAIEGFDASGRAIRNFGAEVVRISDLVFNGQTLFNDNFIRQVLAEGVGSTAQFGGTGFTSFFDTLSAQTQAAFSGIGIAFGQLKGFAGEQSRLIGVALANNIGDSLQNLQVLIQATGESFDDLSRSVIDGFLQAQLTIEEAYNALVQLQNLYQVGLPDALGDYEQAARNLFDILADNRPGRYAIDSLRDIGAEGIEAKKTFDAVISSLGGTFAFTAEQQTRLFEALRINGITSLAQLQAASDAQLLAILRNIQLIQENATAPLVSTPQTEFESKPAPSSGGSRGKSPAQEALEKLREETKRLVRESLEYESILKKITSGELTRAAAGAAIIKLQTEIQNALKRRTRLEEALEAELDKGRKANKKRLADLAAQLDAVNKKIDGFTDKTEKTTRVFKELDLKGVIPFIKDANNLGVVMKQVGVTFETASDILVKGFLQGRMTLGELRAEMDKTEQTLGAGIPNSIGAVTDAFQNLIDAGTQGGQFSTDAFTDIFAEFREKFTKEGSALREAERVQLNANLALARDALANAVGPDATAVARKTLEEAKKALEDFNASVAAPDLADLRSQLTATFGAGEVDKFFRALDESGLKTFEDFEKAGSGSVVGILAKLQELGFNFGQTSQDIIDTQQKLRDAEKEANSGFDPLQQAIDLVKGLNEGAGQLPPVFNATTLAIQGLNGPLTALADGFDDIIEKVAKLSGQKFENDVVFNIRTTGDAGGQALVELLFGDGEGTTVGIPSPVSGGTENSANKIAKFRAEMKELRRKGLGDPKRQARFNQLKNRIAQLGG